MMAGAADTESPPRYKSLGDHMNQLEEEGRYNQTLPEGNKGLGQSVHEIVRKLR